jgi:putative phage-type endonuclease
MYELLNKLTHIINNNFSEDFNKIENIIKNNELYISLDMDEQELLLEDAKEKYSEILEKKKNLTDTNPTYHDVKPYMKKSGYKFGHHEKESEKIQIDDGRILTEGEIMSDRVKAIFINQPTPEDLERRAKIFENTKIKSANMPAQKSDAWKACRWGRIGGSECGTVLNMNKHQAQYTFILDKVLGAEFKGNAATYHGNVFEDVIRMMYEYNNGVHTEEFSSMPHETNPILAASPDGIVSPYCRDMVTPTKLVGRMLEIKAPTMRKIKYEGDIKDTICPIYYWCQIQQQLECLNLDECDFIQCNIERYESRQAWLSDTNPECDFKSAKYGNPRGVIIELIPNKLSECDYNERGYYSDITIWTKTKCLFPPKIDMSLSELDEWILTQLSSLPWGFTLHKIIYWRLVEQNCTLILRDREWFESQLVVYNKIWGYVEYLRANLDVCEEWKNWIDAQSRKYNEKVMTKLDELVDKKEKSKNSLNLNGSNTDDLNNIETNNITFPNEKITKLNGLSKSAKEKTNKSIGENIRKTINLDSDIDDVQIITNEPNDIESNNIESNNIESNNTEPNDIESNNNIDDQVDLTKNEKVKRKYVRKNK